MLRKRAIKISVRLNEQEHEHLKKQAAISGYPMEPFIRALIMGVNLRPRPPDEYAEIRRQLAAIGNNINQIAKRLNESGRAYDTDLAEILEKQKQLWGLANKILMKLSTIQ